MNIQFYVEKLFEGKEFVDFQKENSDAYPCGGFFVIDFENLKKPDNKNHLDYFVPSINKMFSFQLEEGVSKVPVENFGEKAPEKIKLNYDFEFEKIENLILEKMGKENIKNQIQKILLSLQAKDGKDFLVGTVFLSGMGILKLVVDIGEMKITEFEKKSFFDMLKISGKKKDK
ncbi:hypothetical protein HN832_04825 [archaeon]|jgi:hypothetical protein|nr:hypothetical protein [archaeon]MBT4374011.1 hypothetical protein [archaeon]MBT4532107.1 hypothetical protein [archaeon]MBT7001997.1 hypothetical protein [archaeon]MBT7282708.1 hypothetical protein [archaeon]